MSTSSRTSRILIVADDLTGANDTGHGFAAHGYKTVVRLDPDFDATDTDVLVVDTDSRYADSEEASCRVRAMVSDIDAEVVYKKVDSTLRGNLAAEIEAAMSGMDADAAAVAPAFPSGGRTTACGYHLVEGALVTETEPGRDPDAPVTHPCLPEYLRDQGASDVTHVGIERVARGASEVAKGLEDGRIVTFDAVHDTHLEAIAAGANETPRAVLLVGSGGLAEHVTSSGVQSKEPTSVGKDSSSVALGVVGSVSERTFAQLNALQSEQVVTLDAAKAVTNVDAAIRPAVRKCRARLAERSTVVLTSACDHTAVDEVLRAAQEANVSEREARAQVTTALAVGTERIWRETPPDGAFLTGGAVAKAVLSQLDALAISLRGEEVTTGVPVGTICGGFAAGIPLVTKAGAFGNDDTIRASLDYLRRVSSSDED